MQIGTPVLDSQNRKGTVTGFGNGTVTVYWGIESGDVKGSHERTAFMATGLVSDKGMVWRLVGD